MINEDLGVVFNVDSIGCLLKGIYLLQAWGVKGRGRHTTGNFSRFLWMGSWSFQEEPRTEVGGSRTGHDFLLSSRKEDRPLWRDG